MSSRIDAGTAKYGYFKYFGTKQSINGERRACEMPLNHTQLFDS
jgi:hypothetical protein